MYVIGVQTGRKTLLMNYYLYQLSVHIFCNNVIMTNRNVHVLIVQVSCEKLALHLLLPLQGQYFTEGIPSGEMQFHYFSVSFCT